MVVVGDVGRSPRMQYHALSLAKEGFDVNVIGYGGSEPIPELRERRDVRFIYMSPPPDIRSGLYNLILSVFICYGGVPIVQSLKGNVLLCSPFI